jgi:hypothetical protein
VLQYRLSILKQCNNSPSLSNKALEIDFAEYAVGPVR